MPHVGFVSAPRGPSGAAPDSLALMSGTLFTDEFQNTEAAGSAAQNVGDLVVLDTANVGGVKRLAVANSNLVLGWVYGNTIAAAPTGATVTTGSVGQILTYGFMAGANVNAAVVTGDQIATSAVLGRGVTNAAPAAPGLIIAIALTAAGGSQVAGANFADVWVWKF